MAMETDSLSDADGMTVPVSEDDCGLEACHLLESDQTEDSSVSSGVQLPQLIMSQVTSLTPIVTTVSTEQSETVQLVALPNLAGASRQQQIEQLELVNSENQQFQPHDGSCTTQQLQDVADFCTTSGIDNAGGVNVATTTIDGQQVIIVTDSTGSITGLPEQTVTDDVITDDHVDGPPAKQIKISSEDVQPTYMLSLQGIHDPTEAGIEESVGMEEVEDSLHPVHSDALMQIEAGMCQSTENSDVTVSQAWFTTRDDKTALQKKGHSWKMGQWSKDEVDLLHANIHKYCQENNILTPHEVIFEMSKDERKDFYRTVARGLNRPLFSVYRRVIRMYDQKNYVGKYTPAELEKLKELRQKHGSDWATIGAFLGRSASSVKDRCRLMKDTCNAGKWLSDEENRLSEAVYELCDGQRGESIVSGLSWAAVAERVGTRTEKQCRTKWLNYLNWKQKGGAEWTREDDIRLISRIADCGLDDETHLDWVALAEGWPSARSPQWLRGKWWTLKRHVPHYNILPFQDLVKSVQEMYSQTARGKAIASNLAAVATLNQQSALGMQPISFLPLAIPVAVSADGSGAASLDVEQLTAGHMQLTTDGSGITYEILQTMPGQQGALFITQPQQAGSALTLAGNQVIVHSLPLCQGDEDSQTVPVSLANVGGQQVILTASIEGADTTSLTDTEAPDAPDLGALDGTEGEKTPADLCGLASVELHATALEEQPVEELQEFNPQELAVAGDDDQAGQGMISLHHTTNVGTVQTPTLVLHTASTMNALGIQQVHVGDSHSLNITENNAVDHSELCIKQDVNVDGHTLTIEGCDGETSQTLKLEENVRDSVSLVIDQNGVMHANGLSIEADHGESSSDHSRGLVLSADQLTDPHQVAQHTSLIHLSSTADPMFPADDDLIATADVDAEKVDTSMDSAS